MATRKAYARQQEIDSLSSVSLEGVTIVEEMLKDSNLEIKSKSDQDLEKIYKLRRQLFINGNDTPVSNKHWQGIIHVTKGFKSPYMAMVALLPNETEEEIEHKRVMNYIGLDPSSKGKDGDVMFRVAFDK